MGGIGIGISPVLGGGVPPWWAAMAGDPLVGLAPENQPGAATWTNLGSGPDASGGGTPVADGRSFNGTTDYMTLTGLTSASTDYTLYAVVTPDDLVAARCILGSDGTAGWRSNTGGYVYLHDGTAPRAGMVGTTRKQLLVFRLTAGSGKVEFYRDGKKLGEATYDGTMSWAAAPILGAFATAAAAFFDGTIHSLWLYASADSDAVVAQRSAVLMARFGLALSPLSIANLGLAFDVDDATTSGGIITALTDTSGNGHTINVVGSPTAVTIGGHQYARLNGTNMVLQVDDAATLDGATGCTHVLRLANASGILGTAATVAQKGRAGTHINGGIGDTALGAGTRFAALMNSADELGVGPVPSAVADTEEAMAIAITSGATVDRVDHDDTYASNATAATTTEGAGSLTYGAQETGVGTYDEWADVDLAAALYYSRPLNQYELLAAKAMLDP